MELNYKQYGKEGKHLIILHGLFGMLDNWHTLSGAFSEKFRTWILDQRNHGKSPHSHEFNYEVMAEDLREFMEQHGIEQAHIIGHSMGGKTAMQFAFMYPEKVDKLIIADIAPKGYDSRHDELISALKGLDLSKAERRQDADEMLAKEIGQAGVRQFLLKNMARENGGYVWKMALDEIVENYDTIIGPVDMDAVYEKPTLFIKGGNSDYIEEEDKEEIRRQFPKAQFVTLENTGHWVHAEDPARFKDVVLEFLGN